MKIPKPKKPTPTIPVPIDEYQSLLEFGRRFIAFVGICPECKKKWDWDTPIKSKHTKTCVFGRALGG